MKKTIFLCLLLACVGCIPQPHKKSNQDSESKEYTKTFKELGFSITAPCELKEDPPVNELWNDEYYKTVFVKGIMDDPDNPDYMILYLIKAIETEKAFEELSEAEQNERMELIKKADFDESPGSGFSEVEKIVFSDKYPGYVGARNYADICFRSMTFNKGKYIISLTVLDDNPNCDQKILNQRFNKFTKSFKAID